MSAPEAIEPPPHLAASELRRLAAAGQIRAAANLFRRIVNPSTVTFNSLIASLLRRGRSRLAAAALAALLKSPHAHLSSSTLNTLLRSLAVSGAAEWRYARLLRSFAALGVTANVISVNTVLDGLCRAGYVGTAQKVFDEMFKPKEQCRMSHVGPSADRETCRADYDWKELCLSINTGQAANLITYTTMIRGLCAKRMPMEALGVLRNMVAAGVAPSQITYNTIIQGLCEVRRMDLVREIMEVGGVGDVGGFRPDTCTYNILIAAHCKDGQVDNALEMLSRMEEIGAMSDSASYSTLIRALCENGEFDHAEELVDELLDKEVLKRSSSNVPLVAAYNPIFTYLCSNGRADKARALFNQLMENNGKVDVIAYKTLILGHCKEGDFEKGYKFILSMLMRDLLPDEENYLDVIEGFIEEGNSLYALEALRRMLDSGYRPGASTFQSVLASLLEEVGNAKKAAEIVEVMLDRNVLPNVDLSTNVSQALFRSDMDDTAYRIIKCLYASGCHVRMENLLLNLCGQFKFMQALELLLLNLEQSKLLRMKIPSLIIEGLLQLGRVSCALEALSRLLHSGYQPGAVTFHSLLKVLLNQDVKEACGLIELMLQRKVRQNIDLSTDVAAALFRNDCSDAAFMIIRSLYANGYRMRTEKLVEHLCQECKFIEAKDLLKFSLENSEALDSKILSHVIDGLCIIGRELEAFEVYLQIIEEQRAIHPRSAAALYKALYGAGKLRAAGSVAKQLRRVHQQQNMKPGNV